ncbi:MULTISPECIES: GGDEF domain-containing protein [Vibrio]|jgi:diguanylate cyclase (GGDEF)-like protein|uniref:diguanylate cyclase n=4 Tax=Bacteria TaxID=2 RepID=A0A0N7IMY7_VIBAL|nr:GGDEF domain-containing protein [Vibrio sp. Vb0839]ALJ83401.1 GGDEF domain protein [Vibrio alginolyticus]MBO0207360.1 GGDEF domain-containing protein [Vibrio sp. Vb0877]MDF4777831.1 GGDEF domain-containing protein [Vibrio parahaemolyticus]MDW1839711.1 GGDEF domain-containing protein [Vibrio sp. Vb0839]
MFHKNESTLTAIIQLSKLELSSDYLNKKFNDYRLYTAAILLTLIPLGLAEGIFDYKSHPEIRSELFQLRLYFLLLVIPAWIILKSSSLKLSTATILITLVFSAYLGIKIIEHSGEELVTTVSNVALYPFFIFFVLIGFSIYIQILFLTVAFSFVVLSENHGVLDELIQNVYFQISVQSSVSALLIMLVFSWSYYHRYNLQLALEKSSQTDPLTGVANRRHFDNQLKSETTRSARSSVECALILLDIDHFKRINDTFGHPTGDRVICALADLCVNQSRATDLVARLGGEEFAIILPDTNITDAKNLAERIRKHVEDVYVTSDAGEIVKWTISLGISALPVNKRSANTIEIVMEMFIHQADSALYEAKNKGRNQTVLSQQNTL